MPCGSPWVFPLPETSVPKMPASAEFQPKCRPIGTHRLRVAAYAALGPPHRPGVHEHREHGRRETQDQAQKRIVLYRAHELPADEGDHHYGHELLQQPHDGSRVRFRWDPAAGAPRRRRER
ncbi:hypothetical protein Airi01_048130 [Actinoallomurus iriomotensis]|uniref:Uncharacterized protein n=1 Tax=Actinoallomurus iriomotensis TaxID=478107 RepID=A0A9W6RIA2_9ACTN|nr:hypothetical protein Airi01_048130 [Actinoallomurus iriomotensis]